MKTTLQIILLLLISISLCAHKTPEATKEKENHGLFNKLIQKKRAFHIKLKAPSIKIFNPPTYIKFVLKNKKGNYLNIKIGYIS